MIALVNSSHPIISTLIILDSMHFPQLIFSSQIPIPPSFLSVSIKHPIFHFKISQNEHI